jgi:ABC-type multidrug transport system ATPase subunit
VLSAVNTLVATVPSIGKLRGAVARLHEFGRMEAAAAPLPAHERVELAQLDIDFGAKPILRGVDLRLERGERVLMTGPNGSGKSTLTHVVAGFLDGSVGEQRRPDRARVSALLLPFGFIPGTVRDNVDFAGLSESKQREFVALAREFGLGSRLDQDPATLSQGEQRKLQVAMTLLKDADFYLFDEPLSNVDAGSKDRVMDAILARTTGCGLLVIMHGDERFRVRFDREVDVSRFAPGAEPWPPARNAGEPSLAGLG